MKFHILFLKKLFPVLFVLSKRSSSKIDKLSLVRLNNLIFELSRQIEAGCFVQVGAGAGDLDARANFRDGFTYIVKQLGPSLVKRIVLVEPNILNLNLLEKCWSGFRNSEIFNLAIVTSERESESCKFYFSELDAPNYQTCSIDPMHVLKHYPKQHYSELKSFTVEGISLTSFLMGLTAQKISLLSLDIEGIDYEVVLETDFSKFDIQFLSLEHLHMEDKIAEVYKHLENCGFKYVGLGVDWNGNDSLFEKIVATNRL